MRTASFLAAGILAAGIVALTDAAQAQELTDETTYVDVNGEKAKLIACYEDVMMPAKVLVEPILVTPERRQYVKRRDGTVELVEYPAVYREKRTVLEEPYRELREIPCKARRGSLFGF